MENLAESLIPLLRYLLPGFLTAWIFYGLTSFEKPSQFERVVQALIFTIFVNITVIIVKTLKQAFDYIYILSWNEDTEFIVSFFIAILIGFVFAYFSNNDKFHEILRKFKITKETSFTSEWYGAFNSYITYVVLHLDGERRIYGWPKEWPSTPGKGHFVLEQASWLHGRRQIPITGVDYIMIDAKEVKIVEFMNKSWENKI
ncbi:MAG: hypothetical protein CK427_07460 [Leptospira sp.]|nr:MAG: hypothetical protein CK427_07460 [Leptospira sp.]